MLVVLQADHHQLRILVALVDRFLAISRLLYPMAAPFIRRPYCTISRLAHISSSSRTLKGKARWMRNTLVDTMIGGPAVPNGQQIKDGSHISNMNSTSNNNINITILKAVHRRLKALTLLNDRRVALGVMILECSSIKMLHHRLLMARSTLLNLICERLHLHIPAVLQDLLDLGLLRLLHR